MSQPSRRTLLHLGATTVAAAFGGCLGLDVLNAETGDFLFTFDTEADRLPSVTVDSGTVYTGARKSCTHSGTESAR